VYYVCVFLCVQGVRIIGTETFVDPGVKVNGEYYRDVLLSQQMILAIKQVADDTMLSSSSATSRP